MSPPTGGYRQLEKESGKQSSSRNPPKEKERAERHKSDRDPGNPTPTRLDINLAMDDCDAFDHRFNRQPGTGVQIHGWENRGAAVNNYRRDPGEFLRDLYLWQDNAEHPRYSRSFRLRYDGNPFSWQCPLCDEASGRWCPAHVRQVILLKWREVVGHSIRHWSRLLAARPRNTIGEWLGV